MRKLGNLGKKESFPLQFAKKMYTAIPPSASMTIVGSKRDVVILEVDSSKIMSCANNA